jgi:DNA polymerase III epsilon subunit-like protein
LTTDLIVFDTETTGLLMHPSAELSKQPKCIEFGAVLLSATTGEVLDRLSLLINPGVQIEPVITKITGITNEQLADAPPFAEVWPQISVMFGRAKCMMAHNLPFDKSIVGYEVQRLGLTDFVWPENGICTVGLYKDVWGRRPKLLELYEHLMDKPLHQTHRALEDVEAMCEFIAKEELWKMA